MRRGRPRKRKGFEERGMRMPTQVLSYTQCPSIRKSSSFKLRSLPFKKVEMPSGPGTYLGAADRGDSGGWGVKRSPSHSLQAPPEYAANHSRVKTDYTDDVSGEEW